MKSTYYITSQSSLLQVKHTQLLQMFLIGTGLQTFYHPALYVFQTVNILPKMWSPELDMVSKWGKIEWHYHFLDLDTVLLLMKQRIAYSFSSLLHDAVQSCHACGLLRPPRSFSHRLLPCHLPPTSYVCIYFSIYKCRILHFSQSKFLFVCFGPILQSVVIWLHLLALWIALAIKWYQ